VYFPHRTFVSDVSEIPISFPFPELPFSISFSIKNMKPVMVLLFTDRFRPFSSLLVTPLLQAHLTWAWDEHEGRGTSTSLTLDSGHLASPPFALAHALDPSGLGHAAHSPVGLGTPLSRNADNTYRERARKRRKKPSRSSSKLRGTRTRHQSEKGERM
jgi:hypothetical protein